jgi:hypothetical protein
MPGVKSSAQKRVRPVAAGEPDLFGAPEMPDGFRYAGEVITPADERRLVAQFENLPFKPFEFHGYLGNRRIVSYGHRYDYAARALRNADAMPSFLDPLKEIASRLAGVPATGFEQALITEYAPGAGIGWHRDKPMFKEIVGLSFLAPCSLRLRRKVQETWERQAVAVEPRSAYLLRDAVRDVWEHSIAPMNALRYSVTLRVFRPDFDKPVR